MMYKTFVVHKLLEVIYIACYSSSVSQSATYLVARTFLRSFNLSSNLVLITFSFQLLTPMAWMGVAI